MGVGLVTVGSLLHRLWRYARRYLRGSFRMEINEAPPPTGKHQLPSGQQVPSEAFLDVRMRIRRRK
jgi:hypothetical protein